MDEKIFKWAMIVLTVVIGWSQLSAFVDSFFKGLEEFLKSIPPVILVGLLIALIWWKSKK